MFADKTLCSKYFSFFLSVALATQRKKRFALLHKPLPSTITPHS